MLGAELAWVAGDILKQSPIPVLTRPGVEQLRCVRRPTRSQITTCDCRDWSLNQRQSAVSTTTKQSQCVLSGWSATLSLYTPSGRTADMSCSATLEFWLTASGSVSKAASARYCSLAYIVLTESQWPAYRTAVDEAWLLRPRLAHTQDQDIL